MRFQLVIQMTEQVKDKAIRIHQDLEKRLLQKIRQMLTGHLGDDIAQPAVREMIFKLMIDQSDRNVGIGVGMV